MDRIIKKVTEIDRRAISIKENAEKTLKENETRLKQTIDKIEREELRKAKSIADKEYNKILGEAEKKVNEIKAESEKEKKRLEQIFSEKHSNLSKELFLHIIDA